jgi:hypothetical protein
VQTGGRISNSKYHPHDKYFLNKSMRLLLTAKMCLKSYPPFGVGFGELFYVGWLKVDNKQKKS